MSERIYTLHLGDVFVSAEDLLVVAGLWLSHRRLTILGKLASCYGLLLASAHHGFLLR